MEDAEALERLGLPDPDSLGSGDDFAAFMGKLVPSRIRARALRRLWGTNPVLANLDALVEYGEDYTDAATVVENMATAYQVGRGMLRHVEALARAEEDALAEEPGPPVGVEAPEASGETATVRAEAELPEEPVAALAETAAPAQGRGADEEGEAAPPPPRRMRFAVPA